MNNESHPTHWNKKIVAVFTKCPVQLGTTTKCTSLGFSTVIRLKCWNEQFSLGSNDFQAHKIVWCHSRIEPLTVTVIASVPFRNVSYVLFLCTSNGFRRLLPFLVFIWNNVYSLLTWLSVNHWTYIVFIWSFIQYLSTYTAGTDKYVYKILMLWHQLFPVPVTWVRRFPLPPRIIQFRLIVKTLPVDPAWNLREFWPMPRRRCPLASLWCGKSNQGGGCPVRC